MVTDKIRNLMKELIVLCKQEGVLGSNVTLNLDNREYYASFRFDDIGISRPYNR